MDENEIYGSKSTDDLPSDLNVSELEELQRLVFERDLHRCQGCPGDAAKFILRFEDSRLGSGVPWDWVSVCETCFNRYNWSFDSVDSLGFLDPNRRNIYKQYYKSEQWRRRRHRIWERDGYLCQSCLLAKSDQVHHLNYDHFKEEFDFELKSICTKCHCREHRIPEEAANIPSEQSTLKLEMGDDDAATPEQTETIVVDTEFFETVNQQYTPDDVDEISSPISKFRSAFWNKKEQEYQFRSKKMDSQFDCRCRKKKVVFKLSEGKAKRKTFHFQCLKCGKLSKAKARDARNGEAILEADMHLIDKFSQKVADDHSAERRGRSWVEAVAQGVFWPCDCRNLSFCRRELTVEVSSHGYQCTNCGGWKSTVDYPTELAIPQSHQFDPSIAVKYRTSGFLADGALLIKTRYAESKVEFEAMLERNKLSLQKQKEEWYTKIQMNRMRKERCKPECQKLALLVWRKYGGICQKCFAASAADVRHINYYQPAPLHSYNLIPLCKECVFDFDNRNIATRTMGTMGPPIRA